MMAERDFPVTMMDEPKILIKESSQKEKHIVVDALSLRESSINQGFYDTALSTVSTTLAATVTDLHLPSIHPSKPKFLSHSLPNSAKSSPLFTSTLTKRKSQSRVVESPCQASNMTHNHRHLLQELHLRKSKSCGEGRACAAPFDESDLWLAKPSVVEHDNMFHDTYKTEAIKETTTDEGFKCSALCMYLPGFGKAKAVKTKKEESEMEGVISRTVSLEKFECGSWTSSKLFNEIERDSTNSFFDLPMELIKCSSNDVHAPVTSAFVFKKELKGVLKNGSSRASARKSDASLHHVRFSISSSTSHPPSPTSCNGLRKAKEDLNAFLEARMVDSLHIFKATDKDGKNSNK